MYKLLALSFFLVYCNRPEAQNLALHKTYTLSAAPNYANAAPPTDKSSLTDGIYTKGSFWTQPTTVGWQRRQVSIAIDLDTINVIASITFNTARRTKVGVDFPKNIFAFVSADNKKFSYVGDIADNADNLPGDYSVDKFHLNNINLLGRYVTLIIIPKNTFFFCDEIEVLKGSKATNNSFTSVSKDSLNVTVDSLIGSEYSKNYLANNLGITKNNVSADELKDIKSNLFKNRATKFSSAFNTSFVVEKYNAWDTLSEFHEPKTASDTLNYEFTTFKNGVQYGGFIITNTSSAALKFNIQAKNNDTTINTNKVYNVLFVPNVNYSYTADALNPSNSIELNAGVSELFLIKVTGINKGINNSSIVIQAGNKKVFLKIKTETTNLSVTNDNLVNANVWAYLNYPLLADRNSEAVQDLALHKINTVVVPPNVIPRIKDSGYTKFLGYLSHFKTNNKVLLFINYASTANRNGYTGGDFMSLDWKHNFITWYTGIIKKLGNIGFSSSNIYLYPYDEVRANDINDFKAFVDWAKAEIPGIKFYATITTKQAADNIIPLLDVAQIPENLELLKDLPSHKAEIWIYGGTSPSRSQSPYTFYRLMSWKAFVNDATGIGFWDYADEGKDKTSNLVTDILSNPKVSYSVIYTGPNKQIISSRRWEGFSLGIEDYAVLKLYANKFGIQNAKTMAMEVLSNTSDVNKADSIKQAMLKSLQ